MSTLSKPRIASLDLLKGLVMVIMALDHVRDYTHAAVYYFDPGDPVQSTLPIFITRWITHFCAPTFAFLAGVSVYLVGKRKTRSELSKFVIYRGLWLVLIELTIVNFAWNFNIHFPNFGLAVIWVLGLSMIVLGGLIYLPRTALLILSCVVIFGHNLLDQIEINQNIFWSILHHREPYYLGDTRVMVSYPLIPWFAVMSLGYCFGSCYDYSYPVEARRRLFNQLGFVSIFLFLILRWTNIYGDPNPFVRYDTLSGSIISFFNPTKYPPSLLYLLMTLGGSLIVLANTESIKDKLVEFLSVFGRVPFFYYIAHLYLIHLVALGLAEFTGFGWEKMILSRFVALEPNLKGYGFSLVFVYVLWILITLTLYQLCRWFDHYKQNHREKWWLSYL